MFIGYKLFNLDSLFFVEVFGFGEFFIVYYFISGLLVICESGFLGIFIWLKYWFFVFLINRYGYDCYNILVYGEVFDDYKILFLYYVCDNEVGNCVWE